MTHTPFGTQPDPRTDGDLYSRLMRRAVLEDGQESPVTAELLREAASAINAYAKLGLPGTSVLQPWVHTLPYMQQSVLLSAMRNADGVEKGHPSKDLIRWYRRCVVLSAFDGAILSDPSEPGGGSYTGPVFDIERAADDFLRARDGMALHYYSHTMHSFQIIGVSHPDPGIRAFWWRVYDRMVNALHLMPEPDQEMEKRLGDNPETWKAREDKAGGCST